MLVGVCSRNVECWLCAEAGYIAARLKAPEQALRGDDPKGPFGSAVGITRDDKKLETIADLVRAAPIDIWLRSSPSFARFYDDARSAAHRLHGDMPNERTRR